MKNLNTIIGELKENINDVKFAVILLNVEKKKLRGEVLAAEKAGDENKAGELAVEYDKIGDRVRGYEVMLDELRHALVSLRRANGEEYINVFEPK